MKHAKVSRRGITSLLLVCGAGISGMQAQALPTMYPGKTNNLSKIKNPTNSTVLADTGSLTDFYVLPPYSSQGTITDHRVTGNIGFCEEMADLQSYSRILAGKIKDYALKITELSSTLEEKKEIAFQKRQEAAEFYVSSDALKQVEELEYAIENKEFEIRDLREEYQQCQSNCGPLRDQIDEAYASQRRLKEDLYDLKVQNRDDIRQYDRLLKAAEFAESHVNSLVDDIVILNGRTIEFKQQILNMYRDFARLEGGYTVIRHETRWADNINTLKQKNPAYSFTGMNTRAVKVHNSLLTLDSSEDTYLSQLPAILGYTVNGQSHDPFAQDSQVSEISSFPENLIVNARLSLVGACPVVKPDLFDISRDEAGLPVFGFSASYEYDVGITASLEMSYNLYRVYERIEEVSSRGGFFSSSSSRSLIENSWDEDTLEIRWTDEGSGDEKLSGQEKDEIEQEIKAELMSQALMLQARPLVGGATPGAAPAPPSRGAVVIANGLQKSCGWYSWYCTGASWVLIGLDSIFGRSSSRSYFKKTHDITVNRTWSRTEARPRRGITSY